VGFRIDLARRTLSFSPGTLLAAAARRIGVDRSEWEERAWIGQAVHRRVLGENAGAIPGYETERGVKLVLEVAGWTATLEGRLDGRFPRADGTVVVDEVKSLHFATEFDRLPGSPRHARFLLQLKWYLLAVAEAEEVPVAGRLLLADIDTGETRVEEVGFDRAAVRAELEERVADLISAAEDERALSEAKAVEGAAIRFPFPSLRPGQARMVEEVENAARSGGHLLVEAPTGIGKTSAALVPLLRQALRQGRRLFVLTAKTTQQEIFARTLESLAGDSWRTVRLRAKERMCANDVVLCHEDHCRWAKEYGAKLESSGLLDRLLGIHRDLDPDAVFEAARAEEVCPFEVSLELAASADVVLCDYNYAFDPVVSLSTLRDPAGLAGSILLVDEVHNLVERGRGYWSPELSEASIRGLVERLGLSSARTAGEAESLAGAILDLVRESAAAGAESPEGIALVPLPEEELDELRLSLESLLVRHLAELREGGERLPRDPVLELYFSFARFHDVSRLAAPEGIVDRAFDILAGRGEAQGARLAILCKDPSRLLGPTLDAAACVVGMSATLSPPEFYRDLLGFDPDRTSVLRLESPFPRENRLVVVAAHVDTRMKQRATSVPQIAALVAEAAEACPGNVLALFPSYRFLDDVRARLPALPGRRLVRPSDRSTELERRRALEILADGGTPVLLLAVTGGPFAEGVDYPGEMLRGVVVVSPSLPVVRFEQDRMRDYFEERFEKGFDYAYVVPGMTRVVQSAGRVIRSEEDRGFILLACRRFLQNPYKRYLPRDWYGDGPEELLAKDPAALIHAFFEVP
jgi:DNA excision repair protein ERCC-2